MAEKKWTSRKFGLMAGLNAVATVAMFMGICSWLEWTGFVLLLTGTYFGINMVEKNGNNGGS